MTNIGWGLSLVLNVVGGILATLVFIVYHYLQNRCSRRRFRKVFGPGKQWKLIFGTLSLSPVIKERLALNATLRDFPLVKEGQPGLAFSAERTASACEIRAAAYVSATLAAAGGAESISRSDESVREKLDLDFIAFGGLSNWKSVDILQNAANDLVDWNRSQGFVNKSGVPLYERREGYDYGVILRIHQVQFPQRTWITCCGLGETGTSACAWFLAKKWREIEKRIRWADQQFACVIEAKVNQDESATLLRVNAIPVS